MEGVIHRGRKVLSKLNAGKGSTGEVKEQTQCWRAGRSISSPISDLPIKEKKSKSPVRIPRSRKGKARLEKVTLIKRRILDKQVIVVNFLVDDLRFYLEMDK